MLKWKWYNFREWGHLFFKFTFFLARFQPKKSTLSLKKNKRIDYFTKIFKLWEKNPLIDFINNYVRVLHVNRMRTFDVWKIWHKNLAHKCVAIIICQKLLMKMISILSLNKHLFVWIWKFGEMDRFKSAWEAEISSNSIKCEWKKATTYSKTIFSWMIIEF